MEWLTTLTPDFIENLTFEQWLMLYVASLLTPWKASKSGATSIVASTAGRVLAMFRKPKTKSRRK